MKSPAPCRLLALTLGLLLAASLRAADVQGKITNVTPAPADSDMRGFITVQGVDVAPKLPQATNVMVSVMTTTTVYKQIGDQRVPGQFADLQTGQSIEATLAPADDAAASASAGKLAPLTAAEIVIFPAAASDAAPAPAGAAPPAADPIIADGANVTLTGSLISGLGGAGETTGWGLSYDTSQGQRPIEVDMSRVNTAKLMDGRYQITGKIVAHDYPNRGLTLILQAAKIEPAPAAPPPPAAPAPSNPAPRPAPVMQDRALQVEKAHQAELMAFPGVIGASVTPDGHGGYLITLLLRDDASAANPQLPRQIDDVRVQAITVGNN
jgi:hypothetical protein